MFATTEPTGVLMNELAVRGGQPVRTAKMLNWPTFDEEEIAAAVDVLKSGKVNYWGGVHGRSFEREFATVVGTSYAVALSSGTVAMEHALCALEIGPGDEVIIPAATSMGTAGAVVSCGALPVIADVDVHTQCLTAESAAKVISDRTRAIVVVHFAGHTAEITPLLKVAEDHGIRVVEDCSEAHGARYFGQSVGSFGDIAAWSFGHGRIITTAGEGGAITTSDLKLWRRCWEMKDHGKSVLAIQNHQRSDGFPWLHDSFGTNARMTEIQAAIGRVQLRKLDAWVKQRQANAKVLLRALRQQPSLRVEEPPAHVEHAYYRFYAHIRPEHLTGGWNRDRLISAIRAEGIPCRHGDCTEIYRERAFGSVSAKPLTLPAAAELGSTSFTLPVHPNLGQSELSDTVTAVEKVLRVATT
jgi:dTDP-4-amino-4,6-dideoxygalactose transaminase